jgi:hypothetical protein
MLKTFDPSKSVTENINISDVEEAIEANATYTTILDTNNITILDINSLSKYDEVILKFHNTSASVNPTFNFYDSAGSAIPHYRYVSQVGTSSVSSVHQSLSGTGADNVASFQSGKVIIDNQSGNIYTRGGNYDASNITVLWQSSTTIKKIDRLYITSLQTYQNIKIVGVKYA